MTISDQPSRQVTPARRAGNAKISLILIVVTASAGIYLWLGCEVAFNSLSFPFRILGGIIIVCGLLAAAAVWAIWQLRQLATRTPVKRYRYVDAVQAETRIYYNIVIVGILAPAILSTILFIVQWTIGDFTGWMVVWLLLALANGYGFVHAARAGMRLPDMRKVIGGLSITLLASVVGIGYTDFYLPSAKSPYLIVSATIQKASVDNKAHRATIPISITIRNSQDVGVYLLDAYYDVAGHVQSASSSDLSVTTEEEEALASPFYSSIQRFTTEGSYDLLLEDSIGTDTAGSFLNPGESLTISDTVTIPTPTCYDAIQISYNILVMRNDRAQLDPSFPGTAAISWTAPGHVTQTLPGWVADVNYMPRDTNFMNWTANVKDDNFLTQLLHHQKVVNVWYLLPPAHSPHRYVPILAVNISDPDNASDPPSPSSVQSESNRYSIGFSEGSYVTAATAGLGILCNNQD
jgi:hypothetical protein